MAEECFKWAGETHHDAVREGYLKLAQVGSTLRLSLMACLLPGYWQHQTKHHLNRQVQPADWNVAKRLGIKHF